MRKPDLAFPQHRPPRPDYLGAAPPSELPFRQFEHLGRIVFGDETRAGFNQAVGRHHPIANAIGQQNHAEIPLQKGLGIDGKRCLAALNGFEEARRQVERCDQDGPAGILDGQDRRECQTD